jgi:hypothetical protein
MPSKEKIARQHARRAAKAARRALPKPRPPPASDADTDSSDDEDPWRYKAIAQERWIANGRVAVYKEELMATAWNPKRFQTSEAVAWLMTQDVTG